MPTQHTRPTQPEPRAVTQPGTGGTEVTQALLLVNQAAQRL